MKTMTSFAAALAAGMALAPMAASAATIIFDDRGLGGPFTYGGGDEALSGFVSLDPIRGQDTPRNAGESRACDPECVAEFQTGAHLSTRDYFEVTEPNLWSGGGPGYIFGNDYEWEGGGFLTILQRGTTGETDTTLLTGTFVEPVTASTRSNPPNHPGFLGDLDVAGVLEDVVIDEDLAAFYGVPNEGTGEIRIEAFGGRLDPSGSSISFGPEALIQGTVTFSPVPVPAALPLMLTALAGLGLIRLRRMHAAA